MYDLLSWIATQVCVGGGGRGRRRRLTGDPCQVPEHGWTDGRAALADRRRSTAHKDDAAAVYYEQFHAVTK